MGGLVRFAAAFALATSVGVAIMDRGPDASLVPRMAERPVVLQGGGRIFVQKFELTVAEWNACHAAGACGLELRALPDRDAGTLPATGLSFVDAGDYIGWLNRETGHDFRLPTAAEWRQIAREVVPAEEEPLFDDPALAWASRYPVERDAPRDLRPQGGFSTSPEGVADLDGSVWEWTQDCYAGQTGRARQEDCAAYLVGGEHIAAMFFLERDPARGGCAVGTPPAHLGMRLVSDTAW